MSDVITDAGARRRTPWRTLVVAVIPSLLWLDKVPREATLGDAAPLVFGSAVALLALTQKLRGKTALVFVILTVGALADFVWPGVTNWDMDRKLRLAVADFVTDGVLLAIALAVLSDCRALRLPKPLWPVGVCVSMIAVAPFALWIEGTMQIITS